MSPRARAEAVRAARPPLVGRRRERVRVPPRATPRRRLRPDSPRRTRRKTSANGRMVRDARPARRARRDARVPLRGRARAYACERAFAFNAFPRAARFYADAAELWPRHDPGRPLLLLQYGAALQAVGCRN